MLLLENPFVGSHVVTLGVDFGDGKQPGRIIYEIFRGEPEECIALMHRIGTPSNDRRTIDHWWMQLGDAESWEEFARSA